MLTCECNELLRPALITQHAIIANDGIQRKRADLHSSDTESSINCSAKTSQRGVQIDRVNASECHHLSATLLCCLPWAEQMTHTHTHART